MMAYNAVFKALSDPTRREILRLLSRGEQTAGELASSFDMTKPIDVAPFRGAQGCGIDREPARGPADLLLAQHDGPGRRVDAALGPSWSQELERRVVRMTRSYWIIGRHFWSRLAAGASAWLYPALPQQIPTHWNFRGQIDGYGDKMGPLALAPVHDRPPRDCSTFCRHSRPSTSRSTHFGPRISTSWYLSTACSAYMHGVMLVRRHVQAVTIGGGSFDIGRPFIAGIFLVFCIAGQRDRQGAQELLHRRARALDAGQRSSVERHPSTGGLGDGRGGLDRVSDHDQRIVAHPCVRRAHRLDADPVVYSFVHYKALERRGAL